MLISNLLIRFVLLLLYLLLSKGKLIQANKNENSLVSESAAHYESKVNERLSKLENEVAQLKYKGGEDGKKIDQLMGRIERLEASSNATKDCNVDEGRMRLKRPGRLLPPHILRGKPKNTSNGEEGDIRFYGPPTSCDDLGKLGYTLNGYYLVKHQGSKGGKIRVVFCRFKMSEKQELETLIGNIGLKTKSVHFYVQRKSVFGKKGIIHFEVERLNLGGAMNLTSGVFTVPLNGTYHFQFSGVKSWHVEDIYIALQVNGVIIGRAFATDGKMKKVYSAASSAASLKLIAGDRVNLLNHRGQLHDMGDEYFTQFTGWLVDEDFTFSV